MSNARKVFKQANQFATNFFDRTTKEVAEGKRAQIEKIASDTTEHLFQRMTRAIGTDGPPAEVSAAGIRWKKLTDRWIDQKARRWHRYHNGPPAMGQGNAFYWGVSPKSASLRQFLANKKAHANFGRPEVTLKKKGKGYEIISDLYPKVQDMLSDDIYTHLRGRPKMIERLEGLAIKRPFLKPMMVYLAKVEFTKKVAKL